MANNLELFKAHDFCKSGNAKLTVVLIHGIASDSTYYDKTLEYFKSLDSLDDVRFVTFDLLGHGKSYASDELNYDYDEQLEALQNSIAALEASSPLVLVGHSLGTMIISRYLGTHGTAGVKKAVLISSPIYRKEDLENPIFTKSMAAFKESLRQADPVFGSSKSFNSSIDNIVLSPDNFGYYAKMPVPTVCIYGEKDKLIIPEIIEGIAKANPNVSAIRCPDGHSVTEIKYKELQKVLEKTLDEVI